MTGNMSRLRLYDLRLSRLPKLIGACANDLPRIADFANAVEQRLLYCKEAGDEGWYGTWAEMAFSISRTNPYLTLPRQVARMELTTVCERPVELQNQFYEYRQFGNGRLPKTWLKSCRQPLIQGYQRNPVPTKVDLPNPPQWIACYLTDIADRGMRVFVEGIDSATGEPVYSYTSQNRVGGAYVTLDAPYAWANNDSGDKIPFSSITGLQKDITEGAVQVFAIDPTTGNQTLLTTLEPSEEVASYRRYYFDQLPLSCCGNSGNATTLGITAIVKLEPIPAMIDTDYMILQCKEAFIEEGMAIRYRSADTTAAKQMGADCHQSAVRFLNGELRHYLGQDSPAVNFRPFGSADLNKRRVIA